MFVGSAGSESGARGFEAAYDNAKTGKQIWRHYTVPAPNAPGSFLTGQHGGGDVWMNPTIDTQSGLLYIATGNAGSDFDARVRPGRNLWTDSIVALNVNRARSGGVPGGALRRLGLRLGLPAGPLPDQVRPRRRRGEQGGFWHEVNAATGKRLTKPIAFVYQHRRIAKPGGPPVVSWPAANGGSEVVAGTGRS